VVDTASSTGLENGRAAGAPMDPASQRQPSEPASGEGTNQAALAGVVDPIRPTALVNLGPAKFHFPKRWQAVASIVVGVGLWQLVVSMFHPNTLAIVGPWEVLQDARSLAATGVLWTDLRVSLVQFSVGFVIALVAGVAVGVALGSSRRLATVFNPWVTIFYTIPVIAMAPLIIVSLGIGMLAKVVIVVVSAFFPIVINTRAGVQSVDRSLHDVCTAFRTSKWERFRFVILPGSIPYVLAGVRLGLGRGLIGLVFGDLFGATAGLGYLLLSAQQNLQTGNVYVAVVIIGLLGLLFGGVVSLLERRFSTYRADPGVSKR